MGLFDKKYCSICGEKIGLLGNRKLEDGNCCKECASKLSPFFSERRHSTVDEIKEQLAYREANLAEVEKFQVTRTIGDDTKVLIDENAGNFIITSAGKNWRESNPDVIPFSCVTGCDTKIDETKSEDTTTDKDGNRVSYKPPHYTYSYFYEVTVHVNNPYFDEINFRLNTFAIKEKTVGHLLRHGSEYDSYAQALAEVKGVFSGIRETTRAKIEEANTPKAPVKCPCCGATTVPDEKGCCEYCGSAL